MKHKSLGIALSLAFAVAACGGDTNRSARNNQGSSDFSAKQANGQITGAIFTTDSNGDAVNANIYENKEDVYLNGGPRKEGAAGLPDGDYYYLVSDPGCKEMLAGPSGDGSSIPDTSGKIITVENGEFTSLMQLYPYNDTPNPGGEYKVWVTPVEYYDESMPNNSCFGFVPRYSKTDNFKVRGQQPPPEDTYCISGEKRYDPSLGEVDFSSLDGVAGIRIILVDEQGAYLDETFTSGLNGYYEFCGLDNGTYGVIEDLPGSDDPRWLAVGTDFYEEIEVDDEDVDDVDFRNVCFLTEGVDYRDTDKGAFLDTVLLALLELEEDEGVDILGHPLFTWVAAEFLGVPRIETSAHLRDFLALESDDDRVELALAIMNLYINLLVGNISADDVVLIGDEATQVDEAINVLLEIYGGTLTWDFDNLTPTQQAQVAALLDIVGIGNLRILQDEPCTVSYAGEPEDT